jgi:hypothetical protein
MASNGAWRARNEAISTRGPYAHSVLTGNPDLKGANRYTSMLSARSLAKKGAKAVTAAKNPGKRKKRREEHGCCRSVRVCTGREGFSRISHLRSAQRGLGTYSAGETYCPKEPTPRG